MDDIVRYTALLEGAYLLKISFSSCSEQNGPRLATNSVEQGALSPWAAADAVLVGVVLLMGLASMGLAAARWE